MNTNYLLRVEHEIYLYIRTLPVRELTTGNFKQEGINIVQFIKIIPRLIRHTFKRNKQLYQWRNRYTRNLVLEFWKSHEDLRRLIRQVEQLSKQVGFSSFLNPLLGDFEYPKIQFRIPNPPSLAPIQSRSMYIYNALHVYKKDFYKNLVKPS